MKKILLFAILLVSGTIVSGQKSIDALFDRYGGKDGFTTVTINGNLLKLARCFDDDKDSNAALPENITTVRILAQDDENLRVDNFYDMVMKDIDLKNYEEFMRVKDSENNIRMLVKVEGNRFKEFLLIVGGEDNALIQVKGDMSLKEAKKFSEDAKRKHGSDIVSVEQ
ncbi:MAG TPA: DUF4252 domain-containing protein [Bacteroidales bacterium]|nr:DUF4252 domain-containing protein [Bacteroidales bacterium]